MDRVNTAININGVNKLVINKVDILRDLGRWSMYHGVDQLEFESAEDMNQYLSDNIESQYEVDIYFSEDKHKI